MFGINPFPKQQILDASKLTELADDNFKLDGKLVETSLKGYKTLCENKILLVTSNVSFSHSVSKRLVLSRHVKPRLVWERVKG